MFLTETMALYINSAQSDWVGHGSSPAVDLNGAAGSTHAYARLLHFAYS